uniref:tetrahydrofolate synthase n=1 Tax=Heterorhabditis bacteriophora TaxID=37862 RepID=A0A1I7X4I4_HETBA
MLRAAFSLNTIDDVPRTPYEAAILHLNSLQSNAASIQKIREKRDLMQEINVPETLAFLKKCEIEFLTCVYLQLDAIDKLNVIHVSGTKGKGSTCAFAESILRQLGFKTEKVDVAIVEVGIGGEYDSTNIVQNPIVCGISTLDIDHTSLLGLSLPEIAWHKAGILKKNVQAVVSPTTHESLTVIANRAVEKEVSTSICLSPDFKSYVWPYDKISAGIAGEHQKINISLALQLVRTWLKETGHEASVFPDVTENLWYPGRPFAVPETFIEGIKSCKWPGRSQIIDSGRIRYYLDGAHTPKSMEMCSQWFTSELSKQREPGRKRVLVFQCTADRNPSSLLPYLKEISFHYALFCPTVLHLCQDKKSDLTNFNQSTTEQMTRSQLCSEIWKEIGTGVPLTHDCIKSTVEWIMEKSKTDSMDVLITGSFHLVGGILSLIYPNVD